MKILAAPHLLRRLCTWLGRLGSSCSEACPGAPPCPSPLSFLVDCKCIPGPQTCNATEEGSPGEQGETHSHCETTHPRAESSPAQGTLPEAGSCPSSQGICSQDSEGKSLSKEHGSKGQLQEATAGEPAVNIWWLQSLAAGSHQLLQWGLEGVGEGERRVWVRLLEKGLRQVSRMVRDHFSQRKPVRAWDISAWWHQQGTMPGPVIWTRPTH